jgi:hypothetical protein
LRGRAERQAEKENNAKDHSGSLALFHISPSIPFRVANLTTLAFLSANFPLLLLVPQPDLEAGSYGQ